MGDLDSVLRTLRPRDAGNDRAKVKLEVFGVPRFPVVGMPQALRPGVRLDEGDLLISFDR